MFTVALVGPDGAGKTTISRRLAGALPCPVRYVYMGVSLDSSTHLLPTTRLLRRIKRACGAAADNAGPRDPRTLAERPRGWVKRALRGAKSWLSLGNRVCEQWFRQALVWSYLRRKQIVIFDRHYFPDYYAYDIAPSDQPRPLVRRVHGWMLKRLLPRPNVILCLDAPAEVLFDRKGEGSVELLERRRQDYLALDGQVEYFAVVDVTQPLDAVVRAVEDHIWRYYHQHGGQRPRSEPCCAA